KKFDSNYNSRYFINDPESFMLLLKDLLDKKISPKDYPRWNSEDSTTLVGDRLPVKYLNKDFILNNILPKELGQQIYFIKPPKFSIEKEYRFVFSLLRNPKQSHDHHLVIGTTTEYLDLDISGKIKDFKKILSLE